MAKLTDETLTVIFNLLRELAERIEDASATEWRLFEEYGETERTISELEELQNVRKRLNSSYSRLNTALLSVLEAQPFAPSAMLNLLGRAIDQRQANFAAAEANVQEIKRYWNLL